jgi:hypothetical protein
VKQVFDHLINSFCRDPFGTGRYPVLALIPEEPSIRHRLKGRAVATIATARPGLEDHAVTYRVVSP